MHRQFALVVKQSLAKPLTDIEVAGVVASDLILDIADHIEVWSPLWAEDAAGSSRDFGRGYTHAVREIVEFLRRSAAPQ